MKDDADRIDSEGFDELEPELEELAELLRPYRWAGALPPAEALPAHDARRWKRPLAWTLALAAGVALAVALPLALRDARLRGPAPSYRYEVLSGAPTIEGGAKGSADGELRAGQRMTCDADTRVEIAIGNIGRVELEPDSHLRVEDPSDSGDPSADHLLYLEEGSLYASIFAAPRLFQVGTPAGIAVDLGCMYRATVEADGSTRLSVESGQVSFESDGHHVLVPAGASTHAFPDHGPIAPTWDNADAGFRAAVALFEREGDEAALTTLLAGARGEDSLTLWHLLQHPERDVRARVFDRMALTNPPPAGVTRAGCIDGDVRELELWKDELGWSW